MERHEVLKRLRAWTGGTDPASGGPLPLVHVLRHTDVHATLVAALALLDAAPVMASRPRNAGREWSADDDARLAALFDAGKNVSQIAGELERTRGSITARLVKLGRLEATPGMRLRY